MALKNYIYESCGTTLDDIESLLPVGASISVTNRTPAMVTAVTDEANKADLDEAMGSCGYEYVGAVTILPAQRRDLGVYASDPNSLTYQVGDHYFNSTVKAEKYYNGAAFV